MPVELEWKEGVSICEGMTHVTHDTLYKVDDVEQVL